MASLFVFINVLLFLFIIVMMVLVFIVLRSDREKIANILFVFFVLSAITWIFTNLMANLSCYNPRINLVFWAKASLLGPIFMPLLLILFANVFPENKLSLNKIFIMILSLLTLGAIFFIPTKYNVELVEISDLTTCTFNFVPGHLYTFAIFYLLGSVLISLFMALKKLRKSKLIEKLQIKFVVIGISSSLLSGLFISAILPILGYPQLVSIGPLSAISFIIFTFYAIAKYYLFDIKIILTQIFVGVVGLILFAQAFVAPTFLEKALGFSIFALFAFFGYLLMRSVNREIKRREEVEKLSKKLAEANIQLKKLDQAKSEFLSIASHQLYTPLTAIRGYLSMILEGDYGKVPRKQREVIGIVMESGNRLVELIKNLLDISRIESGRMRYKFEPTDLPKMVQDIVREQKPNALAKKLALTYYPPKEAVPLITVDRERIRQVFMNLVDNAIKYTDEGKVDVFLQKIGDHLQFMVQDTGIGIDKEAMPALFKKFSRADGTWTMNVQGTGLGLYVAKQLVEEHGGTIWAESKGKGRGSTFIVRLPIKFKPKVPRAEKK